LIGPPGSGKSCLATSVYDELIRLAGHDPESRTLVACFYFREGNKDLASVLNAIIWITIQTAEKNNTLCEKMLAKYNRDAFRWDPQSWQSVWANLVAPLFGKESRFRLQLVLDGVDELGVDEHSCWVKWMNEIKDASRNISVFYTTRLDGESHSEVDAITIDKTKMVRDLNTLIWNRLGNSDRLRKFSRFAKQLIAERIKDKADGKHLYHSRAPSDNAQSIPPSFVGQIFDANYTDQR
jgi:hypothetical protein